MLLLSEVFWNVSSREGVRPVRMVVASVGGVLESSCFGMQLKDRWYTTSKAKYDYNSDSKQVP